MPILKWYLKLTEIFKSETKIYYEYYFPLVKKYSLRWDCWFFSYYFQYLSWFGYIKQTLYGKTDVIWTMKCTLIKYSLLEPQNGKPAIKHFQEKVKLKNMITVSTTVYCSFKWTHWMKDTPPYFTLIFWNIYFFKNF